MSSLDFCTRTPYFQYTVVQLRHKVHKNWNSTWELENEYCLCTNFLWITKNLRNCLSKEFWGQQPVGKLVSARAEKPHETPAEPALASGFWSLCLLRRVKTSTISGTLFVPLHFPHLFSQSISSWDGNSDPQWSYAKLGVTIFSNMVMTFKEHWELHFRMH